MALCCNDFDRIGWRNGGKSTMGKVVEKIEFPVGGILA